MRSLAEPLRRDLVLDIPGDAWGRGIRGDVPVKPDEEDDTDLNMLTYKGVSMPARLL